MAGRRGWGEDSIYFDHSGECRDPETHRHCPGRWRGVVPLRELTAATVRSALKELAATRATRTVAMAHAGLARAIRHAEANDKVRRNVATLVDTPTGQGAARPSRSPSGRPLP